VSKGGNKLCTHIPVRGLHRTWPTQKPSFIISVPIWGGLFSQSWSASTGTRTFPFARNAAGAKILGSEFPTHILIESAGALSRSSFPWTDVFAVT